jgi:hypothetical protein
VCEADLLRAAADRVGRTPIEEGEAGFEQEQFLLDAIVALQEALQVRVDPAIALRLAKLRRAKGDVGDARGLCERIMDLEPEGENHEGAARLLEEIDENSLLGSGKKKRCFIATAAMGNPDAPEVEALRVIRDECLMESSIGRKMVEVYYRMSPPFADLIARNDVLRSLVRHGLIEPLAGMASAWMRVAGRHRARC